MNDKKGRELCIYCNKPIHFEKLAAITSDGFVCQNITCLVQLSDRRKEIENEQRKPMSM